MFLYLFKMFKKNMRDARKGIKTQYSVYTGIYVYIFIDLYTSHIVYIYIIGRS